MRAGSWAVVMAVMAAARLSWGYVLFDLTPDGTTSAIATSIGGGEVAGIVDVGGNSHAWYWNLSSLPAPTTGSDLHPAGFGIADSSNAFGLAPGVQVGNAIVGSNGHAAMWNGTQASYMRLNEVGYSSESSASGVDGGIVVGFGVSNDPPHNGQALVWTDPTNIVTAPVGLPSPGTFEGFNYIASSASAIKGSRVVGFSMLDNPTNSLHASVWNISNIGAVTFNDIEPAGFTDSQANGLYGDQIVGMGDVVDGTLNAVLWTMSGESVASTVNLNPAWATISAAGATNGFSQVGFAGVDSEHLHAMLWNGTAESALDLSLLLPAGMYQSSEAVGIDADGNIVGFAMDFEGNVHAILWAPEPATVGVMGLGMVGLLRRRRR